MPSSTEHPLNSELKDYQQQFEAINQDVTRLVDALTLEQFNWRPDASTWSIAECIDHLNQTAAEYQPALRQAIEKGWAKNKVGRGPFKHGFVMRWFKSQMEPPPKNRFKAPKSFLPPKEPKPVSTVRESFLSYQETFEELLEQANGLHLTRVRMGSPALPLLRMSIGAVFAIMAAHERRHLWQANQVRQHPDFPTA